MAQWDMKFLFIRQTKKILTISIVTMVVGIIVCFVMALHEPGEDQRVKHYFSIFASAALVLGTALYYGYALLTYSKEVCMVIDRIGIHLNGRTFRADRINKIMVRVIDGIIYKMYIFQKGRNYPYFMHSTDFQATCDYEHLGYLGEYCAENSITLIVEDK